MNLREKQKERAVVYISTLTQRFGLNPNLLKYFCEGKIYYTEEIVPGIWASMDNITYDEKYVQIVHDFEAGYGALVYHCISTGSLFSMLFVDKEEEDWDCSGPSLDSDYVMAAVYNMETHHLEIGDIRLAAATETLIRIG